MKINKEKMKKNNFGYGKRENGRRGKKIIYCRMVSNDIGKNEGEGNWDKMEEVYIMKKI